MRISKAQSRMEAYIIYLISFLKCFNAEWKPKSPVENRFKELILGTQYFQKKNEAA